MSVNSLTMNSEILRINTRINVILPDSEEPKCENKLKTLWLFHGANGDCNEWLNYSSIVRYASNKHIAVVLPTVSYGYGVNMEYGVRCADYLENELIPKIRSIFTMLSSKREDNFVAGASMGGYTGVRLGLNRADMFVKMGSFAGALAQGTIYERYLQGIQPGGVEFEYTFGDPKRFHGTGDELEYAASQLKCKGMEVPKLYMICGSDDFGYDLNVMARDSLIKSGVDITWKEVPGIHGFDCWDPYVEEFIDWLLLKEEE